MGFEEFKQVLSETLCELNSLGLREMNENISFLLDYWTNKSEEELIEEYFRLVRTEVEHIRREDMLWIIGITQKPFWRL